MRTVLVTGGAGFIGSHLVDQLLEGGAAVRVLDDLSTGSLANLQAAAERHSRFGAVLNGSRLEVIIGDVRDRELVRKALRGAQYVFHLAARPPSSSVLTDIGDTHGVNVEGTLNLLQGALREGIWRVVLASCSSVYGAVDTCPVAEDAPLRPASVFAATKVAAESYCRAFHARHQLDTVILRYFSVYGPRQKAGPDGSLVPNLVDAVRHRHFDQADDRSGDDFTYVDDAVAATLAAGRAPRAAGRVINIGSGQMTSIGDVVAILGNLLRTAVVPRPPQNADGQPRLIYANTVAAGEVLDFAPRVSLIAGLAHVVRSLTGEEEVGRPALAPVGFND